MNPDMLHSPKVEKPLIKPKKLFNIKCCQRKGKKIISKKILKAQYLILSNLQTYEMISSARNHFFLFVTELEYLTVKSMLGSSVS